MNKFTLGVVTGISSLSLAVPLIAQVAGAATDDSKVAVGNVVPSQACLEAMVTMEDAHLATFDERTAKQKQMLQSHRDALQTVATISDDTERQEAFQKMHEDMRAGKSLIKEEMPEAMKTAMEAVRTACGDTMKFHAFGNKMMIGKSGHMAGGMKHIFKMRPETGTTDSVND